MKGKGQLRGRELVRGTRYVVYPQVKGPGYPMEMEVRVFEARGLLEGWDALVAVIEARSAYNVRDMHYRLTSNEVVVEIPESLLVGLVYLGKTLWEHVWEIEGMERVYRYVDAWCMDRSRRIEVCETRSEWLDLCDAYKAYWRGWFEAGKLMGDEQEAPF